eukprot:TRINITY_DN338_c1_g1_i1.p1 TRINITY_DN338_c1_g1~~TRINITY_DN338_c1_g1_i1.p1  ORF type:complete len:345 (+),score=96.88 TRINITY_DN338_c1_g1_i1:89-1036(+)
MSSGNPMGLSEISHFGTFQRVGGKAGGFINKKFFHPSSIRNQEKLWQAQTADERERKRQIELQKRRDEERQVEELRKQMYLSGQGSSAGFLTSAQEEKAATSHLNSDQKSELKSAIQEQQKRKAMLKQQAADKLQASPDDDSDEEDAAPVGGAGDDRKLAKSKYKEDIHEQGHNTVWGSWYSVDDKRWGFRCCKLQERDATCPLFREEDAKKDDAARGKKRRRGSAVPAEGGDASVPAEGGGSASSTAGVEEPVAPQQVAKIDAASLMDTRMLEAAEKRQRVKSFREMQQQNQKKSKDEIQKTGYLADLLQDSSG